MCFHLWILILYSFSSAFPVLSFVSWYETTKSSSVCRCPLAELCKHIKFVHRNNFQFVQHTTETWAKSIGSYRWVIVITSDISCYVIHYYYYGGFFSLSHVSSLSLLLSLLIGYTYFEERWAKRWGITIL